MNNSTYPNNPQEAIFVPVQKCPYHVTFDLDLDLDHTVYIVDKLIAILRSLERAK